MSDTVPKNIGVSSFKRLGDIMTAGLFLKNRRGMALLLTIAVTTVLITATMELNRRVRATVVATATTRDRLTLSHIASSGINVAMAMLVKDKMSDPPSGLDSVQEEWADPEKISELLQEIPFDEGSVTFKITDELGRIQVNALIDKFPGGHKFNESQYSIWDNILRPIVSKDEKTDINATTDIINAMKDWMDSGDDDAITGFNGAESEYYEGLDPPYSCRNGPISHPSELFMIKGITPEFFHGVGEASGIFDYMTIYGMTSTKNRKTRKNKTFRYEGKININTASLPVLKAIMGPDNEECAQAIVDYREEREESSDEKIYVNKLSRGTTWYREVPGCADVMLKSNILRDSSDIFRIESAAMLYDTKKTLTVVVKREKHKKTRKWKCRILSWQTK